MFRVAEDAASEICRPKGRRTRSGPVGQISLVASPAAGRRNDNRPQGTPAELEVVDDPIQMLAPPDDMDDELRRRWLAYGQKYDIHSGLLNPKSFQEAAEAMVRDRGQAGDGVALLWIDVLNLRKEFSVWGWPGVDALIRHVAGSLRAKMDHDAVIGRFSRCFLICFPGAKGDTAVRRRAQEIVDELSRTLPAFEITPDIAAGVAFYPDDAETAEDLARYAALASDLAAAKRLHNVLPFQPDMNHRMMRDHEMELEIEKALDQGQMHMAYQPKIDLVTGELLGAEALIRWHHPQWGDVPATEFIPIAERSHLIHRVFDFTLGHSLRDTRRWIKMGVAPAVIAVNVSPANLRREDFARRVRTILTDYPIAPTELELEVTESMLLDDQKLFTSRIRQLKAIGVRVAIDDFGTRYTGFEMLKRLPVDSMKIDRCFIRGIHRSNDLRALCATIVAMAQHMKLSTVAEGIEEQEELDVLRSIGCDAGQGFLLQRPIDAEEFTGFLQSWPERSCGLGFGGEKLRDMDLVHGIP